MGFGSLDEQVEEEQGVMMDDGGFKKFDFSGSDDDDDDEVSSVGSLDSYDDINNISSSHLDSSPNSPFSYSNNSFPSGAGAALNDMSSLFQQLPIKRGLSKHFDGKSQSFTCLSNVRSLEDLAKPENPYNKKLKSCKSYVGLYQKSSSNQNMNKIPRSASSRQISKKTSRPSYSSLLNITANRNGGSIMPPTYS